MNVSTAPRRLYLFQLSTTTVPLPTGQTLEMSSGCYLIETADSKRILIDTGMAPDAPTSPAPLSINEKNVLERLAALNLRPQDIDILICTHFDVDHAGYHDHFTSAELIVQREHYTLARSGHPRFAAARKHWDHPALRYRLVDGDIALLPGVTLLETSGHVPGHQSVSFACQKPVQFCWPLMLWPCNAPLAWIGKPRPSTTMSSCCAPAQKNCWTSLSWSKSNQWYSTTTDSNGAR